MNLKNGLKNIFARRGPKWVLLLLFLIHFLIEKKFSIFRKNNFGAFGKVPPSCGSLLVYVEIKQGWTVKWGSAFDLKEYHAVCCALYGKEYRMNVKMKKDGTITDSTLW